MTHHYDNFGNLASRKDNKKNLEETFTYDDMNRLTGGARPALHHDLRCIGKNDLEGGRDGFERHPPGDLGVLSARVRRHEGPRPGLRDDCRRRVSLGIADRNLHGFRQGELGQAGQGQPVLRLRL